MNNQYEFTPIEDEDKFNFFKFVLDVYVFICILVGGYTIGYKSADLICQFFAGDR